MVSSRPPAYAWDWFARQRLLWREVRSRLTRIAGPPAPRYHGATTRSEVVPMLREDYPDDAVVRDVVHQVVGEIAFLGRTDVPFAQLGARNPPRGMRWWWTALTGEELDKPIKRPPVGAQMQLTIDEVHEGYGDQ